MIGLRGAVYPSLRLAATLPMLGSPALALHAVNAMRRRSARRAHRAARRALAISSCDSEGRGARFRSCRRPTCSRGRVAPDAFTGKVVFVGATALGTWSWSRRRDPRFIGVEVQATVTENLLRATSCTARRVRRSWKRVRRSSSLPCHAQVTRSGMAWAERRTRCRCSLWAGAWGLMG